MKRMARPTRGASPTFGADRWTVKSWWIDASPPRSAATTSAADASQASTRWPRLSRLHGDGASTCGSWPATCEPGAKRRQPCRASTTSLSASQSVQPAWNSNLQPDFNVSVCDRFDATSSAVLRELDESNRFVQKSAESTSM
jgi:hypothetical protein